MSVKPILIHQEGRHMFRRLVTDGLELQGMMLGSTKFEYDVSGGDSGAIAAHGLGAFVPDGAIVVGGLIHVVTTFTFAAGGGETLAIHLQSANDIVNATGSWSAGVKAVIPSWGTNAILTTDQREVTATVANRVAETGKLVGHLIYVMSE